MNELQVETIELKPAKVVFNHEEIEKVLEKNLQKYSELTFTEDTAKECRATIAELRKGKKAVDEYRKEIKKQLTQPVTEFEDKCKALNKKFDDVINPLVKQNEEFEEKRRKEKQTKVEETLAQIIEDFELEQKYAVQLEIQDSYLTKSKTLKSIREELESHADNLKMRQDKEANDKQLISGAVKLANVENNLNLAESAYINLLEYKDAADIQEQIKVDAEREVQKRKEKAQAEKDKQETKQILKSEPVKSEPIIPEDVPFSLDLDDFELEDPFANEDFVADPFAEPVPVTKIKVKATEEELTQLKVYLHENGFEWSVVE